MRLVVVRFRENLGGWTGGETSQLARDGIRRTYYRG